MTYKAISGDSHIVEPPHLWEKWLAPELRKFAPKLVKDHEGGDAWHPHHRCDWLESQRIIAEHMQGVPADEAAAMCAGNAARIYGLAGQ